MAFSRKDIQDSVNRAGGEHMEALVDHHEEAYPESRPTPGDICAAEAERLNQLGLSEVETFRLLETRVERAGDAVRITHAFQHEPSGVVLWTEPFTDYS